MVARAGPSPAPTDKDGANRPPGMPLIEDSSVASSLSGACHHGSVVPYSSSARAWA